MKLVMNTDHTPSQSGFSLVEMIVALAVFAVVITIAVGALLMLIGTNQRLQAEQSVMTNLSFALDSMTREIRTGTHYYCEERPNYAAGGGNNLFNGGNDMDTILASADFQDCDVARGPAAKLKGIAFNEGGGSITGTGGRILYFFDEDKGQIFRKVGSQAPQSIVSSGIHIKDAEFFVTGSEMWSTANVDVIQPTVTIVITAQEKDDPAAAEYVIATTITQRTLDI